MVLQKIFLNPLTASIIVLSGVLVSSVSSWAMEEQDTDSALLPLRRSPSSATLAKEIEDVKNFCHTQNPVTLWLGVNDGEKNLEQRFGSSSVFVDVTPHSGQLKGQHLTANFNNLDDLNQLANSLPHTFTHIKCDSSVFKFTEWTTDHLTQFSSLLKNEGTFTFPYDNPFLNSVDCSFDAEFSNYKEIAESYLDEMINKTSLVSTPPCPETVPVFKNEECEQKIEKLVKTHQELLPFTPEEGPINAETPEEHEAIVQKRQEQESQYFKKAEELGIILFYGAEVIKNSEILRSIIESEVYKEYFRKEALMPAVFEHYKKVLQQVFPKVEMTKNEKDIPIFTSTKG